MQRHIRESFPHRNYLLKKEKTAKFAATKWNFAVYLPNCQKIILRNKNGYNNATAQTYKYPHPTFGFYCSNNIKNPQSIFFEPNTRTIEHTKSENRNRNDVKNPRRQFLPIFFNSFEKSRIGSMDGVSVLKNVI